MKYPDLKEYADEVNAMQNSPPATIELPPLAAIAIIQNPKSKILKPPHLYVG